MNPRHPERIVSLVPSVTEALFALGLGERVVGVTDWCVHPRPAVDRVPKIGGTKDADPDRIEAVRPDLVIANQEENTQRVVRRLERAGLPVWVTYPRTVADGVSLLAELHGLGADEAAWSDVVEPARRALEEARGARPDRPARVFCPIWRDPWMTIGADTYVHDMLTLCGGANVFADRADRRYPRIGFRDIIDAAPEVVLLPDEPYVFGAADANEIGRFDVPAARDGRIHLVDGTLVSWYGPRIPRAVRELRALLVG